MVHNLLNCELHQKKICRGEFIFQHFYRFGLITKKGADFLLLKQVFQLIQRKHHLTLEGLRKIVVIKAAMNRGLSDKLSAAFPDVVPVVRPLVENKTIVDPNWLAGFTYGEGCYFIFIQANVAHSLGCQVIIEFQLTQHVINEQLMNSLIKFFDCGKIEKAKTRLNVVNFRVTKRPFQDITQKIIPFFKKHSILGVKELDFADFCKVAKLMKDKMHMTPPPPSNENS